MVDSSSSGFRFDAEDSDDDMDADDLSTALQEPQDGMQVHGMRVDWGEFPGEHMDDLDAGGMLLVPGFGLGEDGGFLDSAPHTGASLGEQWKTRSHSALVAKVGRDTLATLAAAPEAANDAFTRDKLLQRGSDADAFGTRAMAALRKRLPFEEVQALLAEGLAIGVETRELVQVQKCVRQAQELQNKLAAFDYCEEQMDLRGLRGILNEMERIPVVLPEEQQVRERWSQSNAWLDRAKAILSSPRRTRQGKPDAQGDCVRQRFLLQDIESLAQQGTALPLVSNREETRDLVELVANFASWREEVHKQISHSDHASADEQQQRPAQDREALLTELVERGAAFPIESGEAAGLGLLLWTCQAETATKSKTSLKDLCDLLERAKTIAAPEGVLCKLQEKRRKAEEWVKRAKGALSRKVNVTDCKALLQEAAVLEVDSEEAFLLEYQLEAAESWNTRVQAQLDMKLDDNDFKVLKSLLKESNRIAVRLEKIQDVETRMDDLERKEQEESECEWAQCDGCNKWRRLGKGQVLGENDKFFCQNVAKTCDEPEDEWDQEKEEITRLDQGDDSDADDDVSLADRKLMVPGAMVYAQHEYYPFWPARIRDPEADYITAELLKSRRHGSLLVQFLGKSMGSVLKWVDRRKLVPFKPDADPNNKPGMRPIRSVDYSTAVQAACEILRRQKKEANQRERNTGGSSKSSSDESSDSGSSSSEYSDSSVEEVIDYGEEYKYRGDRVTATKRVRKRSSKAAGSKSQEEKDSRPKDTAQRKHARGGEKRPRAEGGGGTGGVKRAKGSTQVQVGSKKDASAVAAAEEDSAPMFPKWFMQLPSGWQGSYTNYTAVRDAEQKLKERLATLTAPEDIRREVRNMVFCSFISAVAIDNPSSTPAAGGANGGSAALAPSAPPSTLAQTLEKALFTSCGATITADYRRRYRVLAMALRACPNVRASLGRGALSAATIVGMSCPALDTYGKLAPAAAKKPVVALPLAGAPKAGGGKQEVKAALPEPPRVVKVAPLKPLKDPNMLPVVKSKVEKSSRTPSPERGVEESRGGESAQRRSPQPQAKGGGQGGVGEEAENGKQHDSGVELATVGEVSWVGSICKAESATQVRVKAIALEGARLRAVGRVPTSIKVVGRLPPEALAKFLSELSNSRSRHKTVVRFEMEGDSMHKATDPSAIKAYNRLVEEYESKSRVGVINLGQNEQLYIVGPSAANSVLRLDSPRHVLYGVFVMRIGQGGQHWTDVHPPHPTKNAPTKPSHPPARQPSHPHTAETSILTQRPVSVKVEGAAVQRTPNAGSIPPTPNLPDPTCPAGKVEVGAGTGVTAGAAAASGGGGELGGDDVMNAFESIKALLKATEGIGSQDHKTWPTVPAANQPDRGGGGGSGGGGSISSQMPTPSQRSALTQPSAPPHVASRPPLSSLPPPPVPHPTSARALHHAPPQTQSLPPGPSAMHPPLHPPPPMLPPPHASHSRPQAQMHPPLHHQQGPPPQSYGHARGGGGGFPQTHMPPAMPPPAMPPPLAPPVAGGGGFDPNHAQNLQQLSSLSTEHLISLLISQRP